MPRGWANLDVPAINPERDGYCHPAQAKRTKCACGVTLRLSYGKRFRCKCGRAHVKAPGAAIDATGAQPVRPGGRTGCPGMCSDDAKGTASPHPPERSRGGVHGE